MTVPGIGPLIAPPSRPSRRQPRPSDRAGLRRLDWPHPVQDRRAGRSVSDERRAWVSGRSGASDHCGERCRPLGEAQGRAGRFMARECSRASRRCSSSSRWRTRMPASPGPCSPRAGFIELRQTLPFWGPAVAPRHIGRSPGLVDEDEPVRVEVGRPSNQVSRRVRMSGRSCSEACAVFFYA